jgi:uncharacterized RDD family membrane protein YckC
MVQNNFYESESKLSRRKIKFTQPKLRLFAGLFDFVFLFSALYLLLSPVVKKLNTSLLLGASDFASDGMFLLFVYGTLSFFFYQFISVAIWGKTPGMHIWGLELQTKYGDTPTWSQSAIRAGLFVLEFCFFGIPLFEALTHKLGRTLHDRGSELYILSFHTEEDQKPGPLELRFISQVTYGFFAAFAFSVIMITAQLHSAFSDSAIQAPGEELSCLKGVSDQEVSAKNQIDKALALFFAGEVSSQCLSQELDREFWIQQDWTSLHYMTKGFVLQSLNEDSAEYFNFACEKSSTDQKDFYCLWKDLATDAKVDLNKVAKSFSSVELVSARIFAHKWATELGHISLAQSIDMPPKSELYGRYFFRHQILSNFISDKKNEMTAQIEAASHLLTFEDISHALNYICNQEASSCPSNSNLPACKTIESHTDSDRALRSSIETGVALLKYRSCAKPQLIGADDMSTWFNDVGWSDLVDFYTKATITNDETYTRRVERLVTSNTIPSYMKRELLFVLSSIVSNEDHAQFVLEQESRLPLSGKQRQFILGRLQKSLKQFDSIALEPLVKSRLAELAVEDEPAIIKERSPASESSK